MSAWSLLIWACLATMAAVISFMAGTVLAVLEGVKETSPQETSPRVGPHLDWY